MSKDRAYPPDTSLRNNLTSIHRARLEETVLGGLQSHSMDVAHVELFCAEYTHT